MFWKHSVLIRDTWLIFSDCSNQSEMEIKEHSWSCALNSDIRRGEQGVRASVMQEAPSVCYSSPFRGDSSSGKPVLTSTGWENCSGYEEAVFLWIDVCVSFQFHRSRVCNQSSAPTQISKPVSRGWDEVVGCSFWPTHIPPWRNTHTQVPLSRSTSMDFTAKRRERPHHGCSHSTLFLNFSFLINESLTSLLHSTP